MIVTFAFFLSRGGKQMNFLCLDFINSRWYLKHKPFRDPFKDQSWLSKFSGRWNLPAMTISMHGINKLIEFREFMFQILMKLCIEQTISPSDIEELNKILKNGKLQKILIQRENHYLLQTIQQTDDIAWITYQITLSFAELITEYPLIYLKKCGNPECDWIFYDDSKSHTRKWCDNKCASLMKVRKYRAIRKKDTPGVVPENG